MNKFIELLLTIFKPFIKHIDPSPIPKTVRSVVPKQCLDLIKKYEGFRSDPYLDSVNVPTIGYGTTYYPDGRLIKLSDKSINESEALELLEHHAYSFYKQVKEIAPGLNENQLSALTSFCYNLGIGALLKSTLLKKLKLNPLDESIKAEFVKWNKAGGKVLLGLTRRREEECALYFS